MAEPGPSQPASEPGLQAGAHSAPSSASSSATPGSQGASQSGSESGAEPVGKLDDMPEISEETKARNQPSGTHYVEPSPLGIEPVEQTGVDKATNPQRSGERPAQTAEVPLGTGTHSEPPGGGGRESRGKQ